MTNWLDICALDDIVPGTGVCALAGDRQVAIFRPHADSTLYAIDNIDPFGQASVLARGLIGELGGELYVASPLKKQRFRLSDGQCLDKADCALQHFVVKAESGRVLLETPCQAA